MTLWGATNTAEQYICQVQEITTNNEYFISCMNYAVKFESYFSYFNDI